MAGQLFILYLQLPLSAEMNIPCGLQGSLFIPLAGPDFRAWGLQHPLPIQLGSHIMLHSYDTPVQHLKEKKGVGRFAVHLTGEVGKVLA